MREGDIVQITDRKHSWFPSILVVDEVKGWGVTAGLYVPKKGWAYMRLMTNEIEKVGESKVLVS